MHPECYAELGLGEHQNHCGAFKEYHQQSTTNKQVCFCTCCQPSNLPGIWAVVELDSWEAACELAATRDPADGAALVKEVGGVEQLLALLLDQAHAQDLALVIGNKLSGQHLQLDNTTTAYG